jgi:N6-adenosine-specific RNA methylase IME4
MRRDAVDRRRAPEARAPLVYLRWGKARQMMKLARFLKIQAKKDRRAEREASLASRIRALPDKRYGVIYADPPWSFEVWSPEGMDRSAENHYACSSLEAIKAINVPSIRAKDCVLFMWATVPMLREALEVMEYWDFTYKSHCIWTKDRIGTGYWFRNQHELLLVGTRGDIPAPAMGTQFNSVFDLPLGAHSEKPASFHGVIEHYFPNLPKIELFANVWRPGWDTWGAGHE